MRRSWRFGQGRVALRREPDAMAQLLVLVEQLLELRDLLLERDLLTADGVAAAAHDAEQEQVHEPDARCDGQPRLQLRALDFLVDLRRQLVELGRTDDSVDLAAAAPRTGMYISSRR